MRLNKSVQVGMLLALYLSRSGRAKLQDVSENLKISLPFLHQVALKLRRKKVILSHRGPGGGYTLSDGATMEGIINAIQGKNGFLTDEEVMLYGLGQPEQRALGKYASDMKQSLKIVGARQVKNVMLELAANEVAIMNRPSANRLVS